MLSKLNLDNVWNNIKKDRIYGANSLLNKVQKYNTKEISSNINNYVAHYIWDNIQDSIMDIIWFVSKEYIRSLLNVK